MADKLWKATERYFAAALHGKRNPVSLQQRNTEGTLADVTSEQLQIAAEIKQSANPPVKAIRKALKQAEAGSPSGHHPIAIFHATGDRHDDDIVAMTWATARVLIPGIVDGDI